MTPTINCTTHKQVIGGSCEWSVRRFGRLFGVYYPICCGDDGILFYNQLAPVMVVSHTTIYSGMESLELLNKQYRVLFLLISCSHMLPCQTPFTKQFYVQNEMKKCWFHLSKFGMTGRAADAWPGMKERYAANFAQPFGFNSKDNRQAADGDRTYQSNGLRGRHANMTWDLLQLGAPCARLPHIFDEDYNN